MIQTTSELPPTLTAEFDNLMRRYRVLSDGDEQKVLELMNTIHNYVKKFNGVEKELARYQEELVKTMSEKNSLQLKLKNARQLIDVERERRITAEKEKMDLELQVFKVVEMLSHGNINETREKLQILSSTLSGIGQGVDKPRVSLREGVSPTHLSTIDEDRDTMGSILNVSEIDLTEGEDLETSSRTRSGCSFRTSSPSNHSGYKRKVSPNKQSNSKRKAKASDEDKENCRKNVGELGLGRAVEDHFKGSFTPSAPLVSSDENCDVEGRSLTSFKGTPCGPPFRHHHQLPPRPQVQVFTPQGGTLYCSPGNSPLTRQPSGGAANGRQHCFTSKTIYWTDFCQPCEKRIKFGKAAFKCRDCRATCHLECKDAVPLPCVPAVNTPGTKGLQFGTIADYAPHIPPMVPALVVHCTNEVESRGLTEVGIYRVPGSDREIKELRDRFLKGKGPPNMSGIEIHVVCCTLKVFLRSLKEPLIPTSLWRDFIAAAEKKEQQDALAVLYQAISDLPQPNRDTLSWIICHLQRVAECVECKMPPSNLARVFGPTLIGYSVAELDPPQMIEETRLQQKVMELLLDISGDYWRTFLLVPDDPASSVNKFTTPEMGSPARNTRRKSILSFTPLTSLDLNAPRRRGSKK